ncbi:MAG: HAD hydrolase-like protein [Cyanobacteria bacterium P01_F01_bin.150]
MIGTPCRTTLFCDFDGPIVDVSARYYATYLQALEQLKVVLSSNQRYPCHQEIHYNTLTKEQFWALKRYRIPDFEIAIRSGIPGDYIDDFLSIVRSLVNQPSLLHYDCLQPGIRWALELMNSQGVRLILVTLRCQSQVEDILRAYRLGHLFKAVWGTQYEDVAYLNSADCKTALLEKAWDNTCRFHGTPQCSWMIGDTEADILAGQARKIGTVALTCGIRSRSYLSQYRPDHICTDLVSVTHSLVNPAKSASLMR